MELLELLAQHQLEVEEVLTYQVLSQLLEQELPVEHMAVVVVDMLQMLMVLVAMVVLVL
jgi:hypothetical protein